MFNNSVIELYKNDLCILKIGWLQSMLVMLWEFV